jgi:transmembrane sensor
MTKLIETGARRVPMNPQIAAEAAAWIAHMHGPNRTEETERDLLKWQALSSVHREAFEWCTDVWQDVARISNASALLGELPEGITAAWPGRKPRAPAPRARKYAAALALVGVIALALFLRPPGETAYRTAVGEQRHIELEDGSRMFMNTDTRLRVTFNPTQRTIEVSSGEVFFEVAKDARRNLF